VAEQRRTVNRHGLVKAEGGAWTGGPGSYSGGLFFSRPPHAGSLAAVLRPPIDALAVFPRNQMRCDALVMLALAS